MRHRIAAEKGTGNIWDLKQARGGLVDLEFITQFLQLVHAASHPEVLDQNTIAALQKLAHAGLLPASAAEVLIPAARLIGDLTQILRLSLDTQFQAETAPAGLRDLLARVAQEPTFERLEARLREVQAEVTARFDEIVV
jgi:glutamate-ammonia-ligase adenylyltransferase